MDFIKIMGENLSVFTIFNLDMLRSFLTDVAEKTRYIMKVSYFLDVLLFFQNVKFVVVRFLCFLVWDCAMCCVIPICF